MRSSIILSSRKDPDLIALYRKIGSIEFSNMIKDALRMVTRKGYNPKYKPTESLILQGNLEEETVKINLIITSQKDEDIRELLSHVLPGELGNFIKNALRFYLGPAIILPGYMKKEFSDKLQITPVTTQVFVIDNLNAQASTLVKKRKKRSSKPKPRKTSFVSNKNTFEKEEHTFINTIEIPTIQNNIYTTSSSSDDIAQDALNDDDVLAMLENLLG